MNKTLEGYRELAEKRAISVSLYSPAMLQKHKDAITDLLLRLEVAQSALESCRCVSSSNEGTSYYPAQEALAKITQEGKL